MFIDPRHALASPRPSDQDFLTVRVSSIAFAARPTGDSTSILADLRAIARDIDPRLAIDRAVPMERIVSGLTTRPRFYAAILTTFGAIAGFIAVIGLYGVLSYVVSQRTKELGIRMALGARRGAVLKLVLRQGALVVGIGVVCGIAGAAALTRYLAGMLYGLTGARSRGLRARRGGIHRGCDVRGICAGAARDHDRSASRLCGTSEIASPLPPPAERLGVGLRLVSGFS